MDNSPFSQTQIHDTLDAGIRALPAGARGGLFIDGTYQDGKASARLVVVTKIGDHFTIANEVAYDGHALSDKVMGQILW